EVLLGRIRKRGLAAERAISLDYVDAVAKAYHEFFFHWEESPLLVIDTSEIDLQAGSPVMEELITVAMRQK
ncbi:deoxynucleoside kinase, partial [Vibrio parahaemolyticus]